MKELTRILIHICITSNSRGCLSKSCCQCVLQLLRRNFEHIFNRTVWRIAFSNKLPSQWRTLFSCKCPFLLLVLNKKATHRTQLNLHAIQKSALLEKWESYLLSIISPFLCKDKSFHSNSNLTNSVDVKCLYEKCRSIFVSTRIYALFNKLFLLLHTALLKCSIYCKVKVF